LRKLDQYRHSVRKIQNLYDPESARFGYEVPAIIRIGATVTAFNKKAKILHRGIVLAYDARRYGYLVQFERNELGYEFCPDTDVASHGVPEILVPATEFALDGSYIGSFEDPHSGPGTLPYGTTYGSLVGEIYAFVFLLLYTAIRAEVMLTFIICLYITRRFS
jgi:hypothetical protein